MFDDFLHRAARVLAFLAAFIAVGCSGAQRRPPNFVLILTDDQGYEDLGSFGATDFETPNLDRLAREGMRLTGYYAAQAVCSASRASLLTGCYPNRIGIRGALGPGARTGIHPDEETLAEILKAKGYRTAIFGKWHLGHHRKFLPLQHGFDEYLGLPYSNDMWPVNYDGRPLTPENPGPKPNRARYPPLPLIEGNETIEYLTGLDDQARLTQRYTERAVRFIEEHKQEPFFLYVPHSMPHVPLGVSAKFEGVSRQGMYGDVIMEIDWSVGQILEAISRNGLEENTVVVFTSDNGPWLNYGNHAGGVGPLREGKGTSWEGGQRVPFIVRWPGEVPAGTSSDGLASSLDILPTFARIAEAPLPERKIDGVDILSLWRGEPDAQPRDHLLFYYPQGGEYDQLQAVFDGTWKLHFPHEYRSYEGVEPGRDGFPGPYAWGETGLALFRLDEDIGERSDVKDEYPEIVGRLKAIAGRGRAELGDKGLAGTEIRPPGRHQDGTRP